MCKSEVAFPGGIAARFYTPQTLTQLQARGFEKVLDEKSQTTVLRRTQPFLWAYPEVLEDTEYESMLFDCLQPATAHERQFWSVVARGVLSDSDFFPFAVFPIVTIDDEKKSPATDSVRDMGVCEGLRRRFEERVFNARFLGSIERTGLRGPFQLQSKRCPMMVDLVRRTEDGTDYTDETVSAMWFGFKLALQQTQAC